MSSSRLTAALFLLTFAAKAVASGAAPARTSLAVAETQGRSADPADREPIAASEEVLPEEPMVRGARYSVSTGAFLPFTLGAAGSTAYGSAFTGYDGARRVAIYGAVADARVIGGLSLRAGYSSQDLSGHASALFGGRFQFLSQKHHGLDLAVGAFYLPQDIDGEGLIKASLSAARNVGNVVLFSAVSYGQDPEGDDYRAELTMGTLVPLGPAIFAGLDARLRALVYSSDEKHNGTSEPVLDIAVGPLMHYVLGPIVVTGQAGVSATAIEGPHGSPRPTRDVRYGALGLLSAGFAL
ncbi:MAG TPA: hypothetical protein VK550_01650 [Polyangiaceae bacterium]|jgi:hypothetical protein|nr:hypothetical protein [Polyangiaceae bacterium]